MINSIRKKVDFLVIGSGVAGLSYALKVAQYGKVCIVTKANKEESNTKYAQGGIAAVLTGEKSKENHIQDTIDCGAGVNNKEIVEIVVREAAERMEELIAYGTNFDKKEDGDFDLAKEGGHSEHRIFHHKDITGWEIERALLAQVEANENIEILDHFFALDLITQHHLGEKITRKTEGIQVFGVYVLNINTGKVESILSKMTLMASGGAGQVYAKTTNPTIATGDGIAMAYRAKAQVADMEFVQFHPTSLYEPEAGGTSFLISEAVRGFGAILRDRNGEQFMLKYDQRGSLAPRDIVARAIDNEMKISGDDFVYLDCRHLEKEGLIAHFPNIYNKCLSIGIDITKDLIPVVPAAHYICGGIKVNEFGQTTLKSLLAVGECACTGLHGANRLASNSLLEAIVFAHRAAQVAAEQVDQIEYQENVPEWNDDGTEAPEEMILITQSWKEVKSIMFNYVGIVRSELRIKRALDRLTIIYHETEELYARTTVSVKLNELRNVINVAYLIIKFAADRKESIGLHYTLDDKKKLINA